MDCERAVEALIDRAVDDLEAGAAAELDRHLATCPRCRAEADEITGLWNDLAVLRTSPPPGQVERLATRLRRSSGVTAGMPAIVRAAAFAALLLGAAWIGRVTATPALRPAPVAAGTPQWMLLLHEDPVSTPATPAVVAQYARWASQLSDEGRLVYAEKLAGGSGTWLPDRPAASRVTGFFIVRADDEAGAAALARSGPHLSLGGTVEVRRIDPRGGRP